MSRIAPWYALIYKDLDRIAQRRGWNLALHGSMDRDLDVILIPWVEDADPVDKVIDDFRIFIEGKANARSKERATRKRGFEPKTGLAHYHVTEKPHGRKAIGIMIGWYRYEIDISIMPRVEK